MINFMKDGMILGNPKWDILKDEINTEANKIYQELEKDYGPRVQDYALFINFNSNNSIVTKVDKTKMTVTINLPEYEMNSVNGSMYQRKLNLSHELVHTITPIENPRDVTVLEEGLATYFSEKYTGCDSCPNQNYADARNFVVDLLKLDKTIIKKLRTKYPHKNISDFTVNDLLGELCTTELNLAFSLEKKFYS